MNNLHNDYVQSFHRLNQILKAIPSLHFFGIHRCYNIIVGPNWGFEERSNDDFHIIFIKNGDGAYFVEGKKEPFTDGKIIFISPGIKHSSIQNATNPPHIIPVRFGIYNNLSNITVEYNDKPFYFVFTPKDIKKFEDLFEKLFLYFCLGPSSHQSILCNSIMIQILCEISIELTIKTSDKAYYNNIAKAKQFIDEHPTTRLSIKQMADIAGLSPKYFARQFAKQYNISPKQYQIQSRINLSIFMLEETNLNIKEIALNLGYTSQYDFSKQFKSIIGYPPSYM